MEQKKMEIKIKMSDEVLKGIYSNGMMISHTSQEFILDFLNIVPPQGIANARIITSPGHAKRLAKTLMANVESFEKKYGEINEAEPPLKQNTSMQ